MKVIATLTTAALLSLPLLASAQSSNAVLPADQPRNQTEKQQTTQNGQATKYGQPGSTDDRSTTSPDATSTDKSTSQHQGMHKKGQPTTNAAPITPTTKNPNGSPTN